MGQDNLHHRRRAKTKSALARGDAKRQPYKKVLIVCEGSKTELFYFQDLVAFYKLSTANVKVIDNDETCPLRIFKFAKDFAKKEKKKGSPFDLIYCVFDKDTHVHFNKAIEEIQKQPKLPLYHAVTSIPSFEYWLLLHFKISTKPYSRTHKKSIGDLVLSDLKKEYKAYEKASKNTFAELFPKLELALSNAKRCREIVEKDQTDNPSTSVDLMVATLRDIKNPPKPKPKPEILHIR